MRFLKETHKFIPVPNLTPMILYRTVKAGVTTDLGICG
jgi:hypothetical protein